MDEQQKEIEKKNKRAELRKGYNKKYYENNKEFCKKNCSNYRSKHDSYITCECGCIIKEMSKYLHIKSKRHNLFIKMKQ